MTLIPVFIFVFVLEYLYFRLANWLNIIDKPNERSSHSRITLRGGGIIFPAAAMVFFFLYGFNYPLFFAGLILISLISFCDDIKPLPNKIRIVIHFIAVLFLFVQWELLSQLPLWFIIPLLIFAAGIINAFNFMDGINGMTGGYGLVVLTGLGYVNLFHTEFVDQNLINVIFISLLVFNFFNFRTKAKCFAGDVGSVSLAFIIVFLLGSLILKTLNITWLMFIAVYGVDSVLTIIHRLYLRENIFRPHRKHLYQLLANEKQIPHIIVSSIYMTVQTIIIIVLLFGGNYGNFIAGIFSVTLLIILATIYLTIKIKSNRLFS
ncbi:MAG: glycosyltransferase family 4 protein [Planctomycetaceae bacterium]|jgi:UDP-N-acetylmuramyl pentapeptide phosphotransferase/UDP-N-acetylglucosamine-1-phosphate transferase|nr:glycosyltransferase family 4 protein [Planctomycetaceae bacterium]